MLRLFFGVRVFRARDAGVEFVKDLPCRVLRFDDFVHRFPPLKSKDCLPKALPTKQGETRLQVSLPGSHP